MVGFTPERSNKEDLGSVQADKPFPLTFPKIDPFPLSVTKSDGSGGDYTLVSHEQQQRLIMTSLAAVTPAKCDNEAKLRERLPFCQEDKVLQVPQQMLECIAKSVLSKDSDSPTITELERKFGSKIFTELEGCDGYLAFDLEELAKGIAEKESGILESVISATDESIRDVMVQRLCSKLDLSSGKLREYLYDLESTSAQQIHGPGGDDDIGKYARKLVKIIASDAVSKSGEFDVEFIKAVVLGNNPKYVRKKLVQLNQVATEAIKAEFGVVHPDDVRNGTVEGVIAGVKRQLGLEIDVTEELKKNEQEFTSQLAKIEASNPFINEPGSQPKNTQQEIAKGKYDSFQKKLKRLKIADRIVSSGCKANPDTDKSGLLKCIAQSWRDSYPEDAGKRTDLVFTDERFDSDFSDQNIRTAKDLYLYQQLMQLSLSGKVFLPDYCEDHSRLSGFRESFQHSQYFPGVYIVEGGAAAGDEAANQSKKIMDQLIRDVALSKVGLEDGQKIGADVVSISHIEGDILPISCIQVKSCMELNKTYELINSANNQLRGVGARGGAKRDSEVPIITSQGVIKIDIRPNRPDSFTGIDFEEGDPVDIFCKLVTGPIAAIKDEEPVSKKKPQKGISNHNIVLTYYRKNKSEFVEVVFDSSKENIKVFEYRNVNTFYSEKNLMLRSQSYSLSRINGGIHFESLCALRIACSLPVNVIDSPMAPDGLALKVNHELIEQALAPSCFVRRESFVVDEVGENKKRQKGPKGQKGQDKQSSKPLPDVWDTLISNRILNTNGKVIGTNDDIKKCVEGLGLDNADFKYRILEILQQAKSASEQLQQGPVLSIFPDSADVSDDNVEVERFRLEIPGRSSGEARVVLSKLK